MNKTKNIKKLNILFIFLISTILVIASCTTETTSDGSGDSGGGTVNLQAYISTSSTSSATNVIASESGTKLYMISGSGVSNNAAITPAEGLLGAFLVYGTTASEATTRAANVSSNTGYSHLAEGSPAVGFGFGTAGGYFEYTFGAGLGSTTDLTDGYYATVFKPTNSTNSIGTGMGTSSTNFITSIYSTNAIWVDRTAPTIPGAMSITSLSNISFTFSEDVNTNTGEYVADKIIIYAVASGDTVNSNAPVTSHGGTEIKLNSTTLHAGPVISGGIVSFTLADASKLTAGNKVNFAVITGSKITDGIGNEAAVTGANFTQDPATVPTP